MREPYQIWYQQENSDTGKNTGVGPAGSIKQTNKTNTIIC